MLTLTILETGRYFAAGSYGVSESAIGMPLEARFSVDALPNAVVIEGTWQQHSGGPTHAFRVEVERDQRSQSQAPFVLIAVGIGRVVGRMALRSATYEYLASDVATRNSVSARLTRGDKPNTYELSGTVVMNGERWLPFELVFWSGESREALSNVVRISAGKPLSGAI